MYRTMGKFLLGYILCLLLCMCSRQRVPLTTDIASYYNYSTVDWAMIDTLYYRPYTADWDDDTDRRIHPDFPQEEAARFWHLLQNAKTHFHQQSLSIRATSSRTVRKALDRTEAMFDTVFVRCVEQEYYMRLFVDVYNEVMPSAIDELCNTMADEK